jgi:hypothetical protein
LHLGGGQAGGNCRKQGIGQALRKRRTEMPMKANQWQWYDVHAYFVLHYSYL